MSDYENRRFGNGEGYDQPSTDFGSVGNDYGTEQPLVVETTETSEAQVTLDGIEAARSKETNWKRTEIASGIGALAAGGFAAYAKHQASVDPTHAGRLNLEAEIAAGVAVGAAGLGLYGHHAKENAEESREQLENPDGEKKHGWFGGSKDGSAEGNQETTADGGQEKKHWF